MNETKKYHAVNLSGEDLAIIIDALNGAKDVDRDHAHALVARLGSYKAREA